MVSKVFWFQIEAIAQIVTILAIAAVLVTNVLIPKSSLGPLQLRQV
jgi:hypothetical protein